MFSKFATRREFLNCGKLSLLFLLNSCSNLPNKVKIALQNSFSPLFQFATLTFQMSGYGSFSSLQLIKEIDMMAISCDDKIDTFYGYQCHIAVIIHGVFLIFLTN